MNNSKVTKSILSLERDSIDITDIQMIAAAMIALEVDTIDEVSNRIDQLDGLEYRLSGWNNWEIEGKEYLILTDQEADQQHEEQLDQYIDDCILPELPDHLVAYFDHESWKRDARFDGRGHSLSSYDGVEIELEILGTYIYAYRVN